MTMAKSKRIEDFFQQVDLIKAADDKAIAEGKVYKLVDAQRAEHDTVGDDFKAKVIAVAQLDAAYDLKVKEKQAFDKAAEDSSRKLMLWVDAAYRTESERINHTLLLDLKYPADDEKANVYLSDVLDALKNYDDQGGTYPLDQTFVNTFTTDANGFITTLLECVDMLEDRQSKIQDRDDALQTYSDITENIRFWLYKMLPFKRDDKTLKDYGFTPYGTHHADFHAPKDFAYDEATKRFTWDKVKDAEGYEVDFRETGASGDWTNMYEGVENFTTKKPPDPGEYDFRVRAIAEDKQGNWSGVISVNFHNGGVLPAPSNFKFDEVKQEFSWDYMELALLYQLEISRDSGQSWTQVYFDVDTYFNAGHLDTGDALARVRALDGYQEPGDWSDPPLEVTFVLLPPAFLAYSQYKNEFICNWVPLATGYEFEILDDPSATWEPLYNGPNNHFVYDLKFGDWKIRVRAWRGQDFSVWTPAIVVNIIFKAPTGLLYDPSALKIKWDKVPGAAQYHLMNESRSVNYIGADNQLDIELLAPENFRVRAGDDTMLVWGQWSAWTMLG